jgi:hypothetical protein
MASMPVDPAHTRYQSGRKNQCFLYRSTIDIASPKHSPWQEATDHDSIIWGYIIINYADNGLQFFLGDGTFYREIPNDGLNGTKAPAKWLPYDLYTQLDVPSAAGEA